MLVGGQTEFARTTQDRMGRGGAGSLIEKGQPLGKRQTIRIVSASFEVIRAFDRFEEVSAGFEGVHQACDSAL